MRFASWVVTCLLFAASAAAQDRGAPDEAVKDADLMEARARVIRALERKDQRALAPFLHSRIVMRDGTGTPQQFFALVERERRWAEAANTLRLGGKLRNETTFAAPYAQMADARGIPDPRNALYLRRKGTDLRERPMNNARIVAKLDFGVLESLPEPAGTPKDWVFVRSMDNKRGFVMLSQVRSLAGSAIVFRKENEKWLIVSFEAPE
jgi:hypothetical protein